MSANGNRRLTFIGRGLRLPLHTTTTRHAAALYPFHADVGLGDRGTYIGENITAGGAAWCFDPFQLYTDKVLTSPNIVVLGMVGSGKSSAIKTLLYRTVGQLASGPGNEDPYWVAIVDPKGEYGPLATALGLTQVSVRPGGETRINPLDAAPGETGDQLRMRRTQVVVALASAMTRRDLTATEEATIGWCVTALAGNTNEPTLDDVVAVLANPPDEVTKRSHHTSPNELARAMSDACHGLGKLVDGHLSGMFNGRSNLRLGNRTRGITIDLQAVFSDHDALTAVMTATMGWLQSLFVAADPARAPRRFIVLEECWAVLVLPQVARQYQAWQKLARRYGVANIAVAHRLADFSAQVDDGTATAKIGHGFLADTQTQILFRQPKDQMALTAELLGLTPPEQDLIPSLAIGRALWKVANHSAIVQHRIGSHEWDICQTDAQLSV